LSILFLLELFILSSAIKTLIRFSCYPEL